MKCKEDIWVEFAAAALSRISVATPEDAGRLADQLLSQFEQRYGDIAQIIEGIQTCSSCQERITGQYLLSDGKDGEYKKFCMTCVEKHQAEVAIQSPAVMSSNPGIAPGVCTRCGQSKNTIFACPGEPQPVVDDGTRHLSESEMKVLGDWRNRLQPDKGTAHSFVKE